MKEYITVSEFSKITGKDSGNIRKLLIKGVLEGEKIGNQWLIPKDAIYPEDRRVKSGNYRNWRHRKDIWQANGELMPQLVKMCSEIGKIYGDALEKIILYGSYARGEQTSESDVDLALILKKTQDEKAHEKMTDTVVDYELEQGVTLSVIPIEFDDYQKWGKTLPFYKNMIREGIVLWKSK